MPITEDQSGRLPVCDLHGRVRGGRGGSAVFDRDERRYVVPRRYVFGNADRW